MKSSKYFAKAKNHLAKRVATRGVALAIMISAASVAVTGNASEKGSRAASQAASEAVISVEACETLTLEVTLNKDNRSSKGDLLKALHIMNEYADRDFLLKPQLSTEAQPVFLIGLSLSVEDLDAQLRRSWETLQRKLGRVKGVALRCSDTYIGGDEAQQDEECIPAVTGSSRCEESEEEP